MKAKISEIFNSIQGEGLYLGERQVFIRFFGCNLDCKYCDTRLACFEEYEILQLINLLKPRQEKYQTISFTGGEPLMQVEFLKEMLKVTRHMGFRNYLETNGTLPDELAEVIDDLHVIAMDIKLPSSTGLEFLWEKHARFLSIASKKEVFVKSVICSTTTDDDFLTMVRLIKKVNSSVILVLQPNGYENHGALDGRLEDLKEKCRAEGLTACVIGQVQKRMGIR